MRVHNELGPGLREKPYENALTIELRQIGLAPAQQHAFPVHYRDKIVGDCIPDITIPKTLIIEVKAIEALSDNETAQALNYLRISNLELALVINFKPHRLEWKRVARTQS
ncbi:MAG: GxxExxY protein [Verrucomicrobiales bacterium]|nr:GxxExxY protein [Verrucomicrobiales bacterium]